MSNSIDTTTADLVGKLTALNERILQAEEAGLKDDLDPLLADGFIIIRSNGEVERQDFLDAVPNNANRGRRAVQPNVQLIGQCAIFTCIVTTTQHLDGTRIPTVFGTHGCLFERTGSGAALPGT
jgi:hypothetical protein